MIRQTCKCNASPDKVFSVFMTGHKFQEMTNMPAELSADVGSKCSMFGGMIAATNIEIIDGKRLVQAWRPGNWDEGVYSIVRFDFEADGEETLITLTHTGYPPGSEEHLNMGWKERYWEPLKAYLS